MKKFFIILSSLLLSASLFAQTWTLPAVREIATIEKQDGSLYHLVNIPSGDENRYYVDFGKMSMGDNIFSITVNPVENLYIFLGNNLTDAIAKLQEIKDLCSMEKGESTEILGSYSLLPSEDLEEITVTRYQYSLGKKLQFSIQKDDYMVVTYVSRGDISSLLSQLKFHKKLHPKE